MKKLRRALLAALLLSASGCGKREEPTLYGEDTPPSKNTGYSVQMTYLRAPSPDWMFECMGLVAEVEITGWLGECFDRYNFPQTFYSARLGRVFKGDAKEGARITFIGPGNTEASINGSTLFQKRQKLILFFRDYDRELIEAGFDTEDLPEEMKAQTRFLFLDDCGLSYLYIGGEYAVASHFMMEASGLEPLTDSQALCEETPAAADTSISRCSPTTTRGIWQSSWNTTINSEKVKAECGTANNR